MPERAKYTKRVLLVTYAWPPRGGVGLLRPLSFARHLPGLGWDVTVLTVEHGPTQSHVDELEAADIDADVVRSQGRSRGGGWSSRLGSGPFSWWVSGGVSAGLDALRRQRIDAILSTSPPIAAHLIARKLHRVTGIPWVADLRDPWSRYHHERRFRLRSWLDGRLERRTLADADALVTISEPLARVFESDIGRRVQVVPNGFEPHELKLAAMPESRPLVLRYLGKMHPRFQNPEPLLSALAKLTSAEIIPRDEVRFEVYLVGYQQPDIEQRAVAYGIDDVVEVFAPVSLGRARELVASAGAIPIFDWSGNNAVRQGVVPVKLYEAMGSSRPVILVGSNGGAASEIIRACKAGYVTQNDDELCAALVELHRSSRAGKPAISPIEPEVQRYSRRCLTSRLADVLDGVVPH